MCGIFGFLGQNRNGLRIDTHAVLESLRHRGPDDCGVFREDSTGSGTSLQSCILIHTRLSILDLSVAGHQPMSTPDGRWCLVFNGELYNHRDLRESLERDGQHFVGESDTEVVLHAMARWGTDALRRFTGMFALALWDTKDASMTLARDRFGEKPLYFSSNPRTGDLVFASEVRTLLASGVVDRIASRRGVETFLETGSVLEPWTIVRDVWALPPATVVRYRAGSATAECYWRNTFGQRPSTTLADAAPLVRAALEKAVRRQLVADVPVGLFLSAGMDSTAIASIAARMSKGVVRSFTVSLQDTRLDEGAVASNIARQLGCQHHDVPVTMKQATTQVPEAVAALDQPSIDGPNTFIISKAVRASGIVVALSGIGGDEVFAGYRSFRTVRNWVSLNRAARALGARKISHWLLSSTLPLTVSIRKAVALAGADPASRDFYRSFRGLFSAGQIERLLDATSGEMESSEPYPEWIDSVKDHSAIDADLVSQLSQAELDGYLLNTLLRDTDGMSMSQGLEIRAPFLDHHLVELAASVYGTDKIGGPVNKPLLLAAVPEIPPLAIGRQKTGFRLPFDTWLNGSLREWADASMDAMPHGLSRAQAQNIWNLFLQRSPRVSWSRAWALLVLSSWLQRNRVSL